MDRGVLELDRDPLLHISQTFDPCQHFCATAIPTRVSTDDKRVRTASEVKEEVAQRDRLGEGKGDRAVALRAGKEPEGGLFVAIDKSLGIERRWIGKDPRVEGEVPVSLREFQLGHRLMRRLRGSRFYRVHHGKGRGVDPRPSPDVPRVPLPDRVAQPDQRGLRSFGN